MARFILQGIVDVAMLTALLHKDEKKLTTSQSASLVHGSLSSNPILRENEKRAAELESVKATINRLTTGDEHITRVDDDEVNGTVSLDSRNSVRRLDVHDPEPAYADKFSYGPVSTEYSSSYTKPIQRKKEIHSTGNLNSCSSVHEISIVNINNENTKEVKQLCDQVGGSQLKAEVPPSQVQN